MAATGKLTVVGFDAGKDQIDAIKSGGMAGAITQNPVGRFVQCAHRITQRRSQ